MYSADVTLSPLSPMFPFLPFIVGYDINNRLLCGNWAFSFLPSRVTNDTTVNAAQCYSNVFFLFLQGPPYNSEGNQVAPCNRSMWFYLYSNIIPTHYL